MNLSTDLRAALLSQEMGGIIVLERTLPPIPAILARLPLRRSQITGMPIGYGQMELFTYEDDGAVVRMIIRCFDQPNHPLEFELFLNPSDAPDRHVIEELSRTETIEIHFFGAEVSLPYLSSKRLKWDERKREGARQLLVLTEGIVTRWPEAKERVMREHPF